jgi:hypothetical protein
VPCFAIDLDHFDAAIRIFDANYNVEGIRQKRSRLPRSARYRATSRARRLMPCGTRGPMTTKELAREVMAERWLGQQSNPLTRGEAARQLVTLIT